jgi:hypothetical protein
VLVRGWPRWRFSECRVQHGGRVQFYEQFRKPTSVLFLVLILPCTHVRSALFSGV